MICRPGEIAIVTGRSAYNCGKILTCEKVVSAAEVIAAGQTQNPFFDLRPHLKTDVLWKVDKALTWVTANGNHFKLPFAPDSCL